MTWGGLLSWDVIVKSTVLLRANLREENLSKCHLLLCSGSQLNLHRMEQAEQAWWSSYCSYYSSTLPFPGDRFIRLSVDTKQVSVLVSITSFQLDR